MLEIDKFIDERYREYKGFDFIKKISQNNPEFAETLEKALFNGKAEFFGEEIFEALDEQNHRIIPSTVDIFREGYNVGGCTTCSIQLSYAFNHCNICGGTLSPIIGTKNSPEGEHTWVVKDKKVYDTSLMLIFDEGLAPEFGYNMENSYNPNIDPIYRSAKHFTNDKNLRRKEK